MAPEGILDAQQRTGCAARIELVGLPPFEFVFGGVRCRAEFMQADRVRRALQGVHGPEQFAQRRPGSGSAFECQGLVIHRFEQFACFLREGLADHRLDVLRRRSWLPDRGCGRGNGVFFVPDQSEQRFFRCRGPFAAGRWR